MKLGECILRHLRPPLPWRRRRNQEQFIRSITGVDDPSMPLRERVAKTLGPKTAKAWHTALIDLVKAKSPITASPIR